MYSILSYLLSCLSVWQSWKQLQEIGLVTALFTASWWVAQGAFRRSCSQAGDDLGLQELLGYKGSPLGRELTWNQLCRKELSGYSSRCSKDQARALPKKEPALCQKAAVPISSMLLNKSFPLLIPWAGMLSPGAWNWFLEWCAHVFVCLWCEYIDGLPDFFKTFFSAGRLTKKDCFPKFCSTGRSPFHGPAQDILHENTIPFHETRLDLMQLSLYIFASLFQDDSFTACENSGRWEDKKNSVWSQCQNFTSINVIWAVRSDKHLTEQTQSFEKNINTALLAS